MARIARVIIPNIPHHLTQRGNYRQIVFDTDHDRTQYLLWIKEYSERYGVKVWAYCLMDNHVHFIVVPNNADSLAKTFNQVHMRYSQYHNEKIGKRGHLWQGRFYSCPLDGVHLYADVRYIERNPVRAGIAEKSEDYIWSSAASHVKKIDNPILSKDLPLIKSIEDWAKYLDITEEEGMLKRIRGCTSTGRPVGDESFVARLEELLRRTLSPKAIGRPRKR